VFSHSSMGLSLHARPALSTTWAASRHSFLRRVDVMGFSIIDDAAVCGFDGDDLEGEDDFWVGGFISENIPPKHWTRSRT